VQIKILHAKVAWISIGHTLLQPSSWIITIFFVASAAASITLVRIELEREEPASRHPQDREVRSNGPMTTCRRYAPNYGKAHEQALQPGHWRSPRKVVLKYRWRQSGDIWDHRGRFRLWNGEKECFFFAMTRGLVESVRATTHINLTVRDNH
jgi:hypothetical protein